MTETEISAIRPGSIVAGTMLLGLGAAVFLDRSGLVPVRTGQLIAPFILIALGSGIVLERGVCGRPFGRRRRRGAPTSGLWLIGIGIWMLMSQLHVFGLTFATSWPLFIILTGIMMVVRGVTPGGRFDRDRHHD
jgi:hypothetical protein